MNLFELFVKIGAKDEASDKINGISKLASGLGKGLATAAKISGAAIGAAATGIAALTKSAVENYAEYEQLVGGVETLFNESADRVKQYASEAYRSAGLSANEYMSTVTGFSASLLQSLGKGAQTDLKVLKENLDEQYDATKKSWQDRIKIAKKLKQNNVAELEAQMDAELKALKKGNEQKLAEAETANNKSVVTAETQALAADLANQAVIDMADNAAKMGTSMEMIQNAYAGFAKQNYTMLDNLKLGYGGTQSEMQRLIKDAAALDSSIDANSMSFANIVKAINVVQTKMGITGTTAKEAGRTIEGSVNAMKSAWTNLVTGFADGSADIGGLIDNLVTTIVGDGTENNLGVIGNVLPAIQRALGGIGKLIEGLAPIIEDALPKLIKEILPPLLKAGGDMIVAIVNGLIAAAPAMYNSLKEVVISILASVFGVTEEEANSFFTSIEDAVKTAVKAIKDAYFAVSDAINSVVQGFRDAIEWGKEHETALTLIGIAIGTVTAAIAAYNIAQAIQNAGGIAAIAQMALMKVQMVALTVAQAAQTAATWVATTATTAFGAAMAFLTSPITLVVAGIGALIAIIVLCVKHWDDIKEAASNAWEWIKDVWSNVASWFDEKVLQPIKDIGKKFADIGKNIVDGLKKGISNAWNNLVKWFKGLFGDLIGIAKKILGIASPSKVFKKLGSWTADGFGIGFEDEFAHVKDDMEDALNFDDASVGINASIRKVGAGAAGGAFGGTSIGNININIDGAKYTDEQSLASAIALEIQNMTDRRAAVYA